jgi:hypothetical protein
VKVLIVYCFAYALLLGFGIRSIRKNGRKREAVWYILLIGWCILINVSSILGTPTGLITQLQDVIFLPVGQWLQYLLGGVST